MATLSVAIKNKLFSYQALNNTRRAWSEFWFQRQGASVAQVGKFDLVMPSAHPLPALIREQPYRDLFIGISAKYLGEKYEGSAILDIGANIGDSAAMIATYCQNDLILVEPSPFFFRFLEQNVKKFPNDSSLESVFISPEDSLHGRLVHWGGTAFFESGASPGLKTKQLSSFDRSICMVKIDTDGNDFNIINNSIDWFEKSNPGIAFECQIRSSDEVRAAEAVFENLIKIGYCHFIIFDDTGNFILSTCEMAILKSLGLYLYRNSTRRRISYYDIVALHGKDRDVHENIVHYFVNQGW